MQPERLENDKLDMREKKRYFDSAELMIWNLIYS